MRDYAHSVDSNSAKFGCSTCSFGARRPVISPHCVTHGARMLGILEFTHEVSDSIVLSGKYCIMYYSKKK